MAKGVNYWSSYEPSYKVRECVWGDDQESSSEEGGGGVTWETQAMEVKGQLISAPDPLTCPDRKQREQMAELQERRRSLQALLSTRLAELRRICLQEAELTGSVPSDFPLEEGEKPPCVRRRGGASRQANRKCRAEEEECQRSKPKKTLFSGALRKHTDSEHNTHTQTHTHHGKRTVHRGCHTDDTVRSESSSTSDSTGHDNDDSVSQCRPLLVTSGSPVEVFYQNKTRRNSVLNRVELPETLQTHKPLPMPPSHPPHPPPRSQDSSSSSAPSDPAGEGGVRMNAARLSNSSDGLLDHIAPPEEEGGSQQGGFWVNGQQGSRGTSTGGVFRSSETLTDGRSRTRTNNGVTEGGGVGRGRGGVRVGGGYSEVLLDYVWGKQQQLQRQQSQPNSRKPITSHQQLLFNGYSSQQPSGAPPTYRGHQGDQRRVKVTRTKSCGPFLPVQQDQTDAKPPPLSTIQPDPHPHLLPPRPPHLPPSQDAQLEDATRSLHKALALEAGERTQAQTPRAIRSTAQRSQGMVPEEHDWLIKSKPSERKCQHRGQRQSERWGQRSVRRSGRGYARQTQNSWFHPAVDLSDGDKSPQEDTATLGHLPRTPVTWQVCGRLDLPRLLPDPETGGSTQRPDPGPAISRNSGLTHGPIRTLTDRHADQSQAGSWDGLLSGLCAGSSVKPSSASAAAPETSPKAPPTVMSLCRTPNLDGQDDG